MNMSHLSRRGRPRANQHGMTLVVSLIMLVVITLFVLSAIRLSTANLRTVGNMQARNEAAAASQRAIEDMMSSTAAFTAPGHRPHPRSRSMSTRPTTALLVPRRSASRPSR